MPKWAWPVRLVAGLAVASLAVAFGEPPAAQPAPAPAAAPPDDGAWHALPVTGGRATLAALGIPDSSALATVMVDLVRRLHFSATPPTRLEAAVRSLSKSLAHGAAPSAGGASALSLPLPLPVETWSRVIFERDVPPPRLFVEILADPAARLLYHGLAGLDAGTRRWIATQSDLLQRLYRNGEAVRSFALFAPALRVDGGRVVVPGGGLGEERWSAVLDTTTARPAQFVQRLFEHQAGRTAGLYFLASAVEPSRQRFLLSASTPGTAGSGEFGRLVTSFAQCYPANSTAYYPFAVRSYDAALLLLEVQLTEAGLPAGPTPRRFWERVFAGEPGPGETPDLSRPLIGGDRIGAAWMVETVCAAPSPRRGAVFATLLAGHRVFAGLGDADLPDTLAALRARQTYPAVFMALEHAGIRRARPHAAVAAHAARLARLDQPERGITAVRQFQGALALILNAASATTLELPVADALLESLAAVPFDRQRYDGAIADWIQQRLRPAIERATGLAVTTSAEELVVHGLAGPAGESRPIRWEGLDYAVDLAGAARQRLREVRRRQGGLTLDAALDLHRIATDLRRAGAAASRSAALRAELAAWGPQLRALDVADEYAGAGLDPIGTVSAVERDLARLDGAPATTAAAGGDALMPVADFLLGHVLASWAYAPHVGESDSAALTAGDGSLRHVLGLRSPGRRRVELRWELAVADLGAISGSLLGLQAALAPWSLRRLSLDVVPGPPAIGGNDLTSLLLTAALSDPRRLTDADMARLAAAVADGTAAIDRARSDERRLAALATAAAISPWRREALPWMLRAEPDRVDEQFSMMERARLGGLRADGLHAWGSVSIATGCLCLRLPPPRIPEVILGRAADGIVGGQSADLMLRVATLLAELNLPASLATAVLRYAMRAFLDAVAPAHTADVDAFARQARALDRGAVEDYLGAIAAIGPLRPRAGQP
jgi:hypothetical protein